MRPFVKQLGIKDTNLLVKNIADQLYTSMGIRLHLGMPDKNNSDYLLGNMITDPVFANFKRPVRPVIFKKYGLQKDSAKYTTKMLPLT
jgi:hypothetical protein